MVSGETRHAAHPLQNRRERDVEVLDGEGDSIGAAADAVNPLLLISDLGRPERFHHMLRVFKVTSPMNVGAWVLFVNGGASTTAAVLELLGILKPLKLLAELVSFIFGPPLATYTGVLVADTAIPVWPEK